MKSGYLGMITFIYDSNNHAPFFERALLDSCVCFSDLQHPITSRHVNDVIMIALFSGCRETRARSCDATDSTRSCTSWRSMYRSFRLPTARWTSPASSDSPSTTCASMVSYVTHPLPCPIFPSSKIMLPAIS